MGIRSIFGSLSVRLFVLLSATIVVTFGVYAVVSIRFTSQHWEQSVDQGAHEISELIQYAAHHGMLLNRRSDVQQVIGTIAESASVESVRIYDKQGVIKFSGSPEEIGRSVPLTDVACVHCHEGGTPQSSGSDSRIFSAADGRRILGVINPIENAPDCSAAACHAHPPEQSILGVLDVMMSMEETDHSMATATSQAAVAAGVMALVAGLLSAAFVFRLVRQPVGRLIRGVERVASGELDTAIEMSNHSEIGQLAEAFNGMTRDLRRARGELTKWSDRLEVKLHEKTAELSRTQRQVAHMDKMASLGKLAATVAHELNNPLAGILNYAKLVERTLDESEEPIPEREELRRYLSLIQREASRSGTIVRNLLSFARPSGGEFALHSLNPILERAAMLIAHHLEMSDIRLEKEVMEGDDRLVCDADQIQQALLALLVNAIEAMPDGGALRISAKGTEDSVSIEVGDTGTGIPQEALPHIFEPFFSSKDGMEGAGLGLAVVYGIVQRHGGETEVESQVDQGTTFRIVLPRRPPVSGRAEHDAGRSLVEERRPLSMAAKEA